MQQTHPASSRRRYCKIDWSYDMSLKVYHNLMMYFLVLSIVFSAFYLYVDNLPQTHVVKRTFNVFLGVTLSLFFVAFVVVHTHIASNQYSFDSHLEMASLKISPDSCPCGSLKGDPNVILEDIIENLNDMLLMLRGFQAQYDCS